MAKHSVCHFEWSSTDLERTKKFLEGLFDWKFQAWGDEYLLFDTPEGPGGGIMKVDKVEIGKSPYIYIEVDEIEPYLEKVKTLGGSVDTPKTEIPTVGWHAHLVDPDGNIIGLFQNLPKEK
jgi:predicted enzyme related to lactoylglutathione lyase